MEKTPQTVKKSVSVAFYILYILHTRYVVIITLFSLFCSFSIFYTHCYIVMFCYSTYYTILLFPFLFFRLKIPIFSLFFSVLQCYFCALSQKNVFLSYSVSTHYNVLTFFNKHFCSYIQKKVYLCSK